VHESNQYDNQPGTPRRGYEVIRHRLRGKLDGRGPIVALATVGLLGLGLAGVSAAVSDNGSAVTPTAAMASADAVRADAAGRADRSARESAAPAATSAAPATTAPAPKAAPATKAAPKPTKKAAPATKKPAPKPAWVSPMPGAEITSCFGPRWGVMHAGVDLAAPENTPIHAVGAGTVVETGWAFSGYGISVVVDHGNGYLTHYAHMNKVAVKVGQKVAPGQRIGFEGSTGDSTGPHLHFEVHKGMWNQVDPGPWMRAHGAGIGC